MSRQFPSCTKGDWAGFPALLSPNNVMVLFTKVDRAAAHRAAERDLAFRLARHRRRARACATYQARADVEPAAALHDRRGRLRAGQQRHLAECRRRARPDQGADRRGARQGRPAAGRRRVRLHGGAGQCAGGVCRQLSGRAVQPRASLAGGAVVRAALVPEAPERAGARRLRRRRADRGRMQGAARRRPHLAGAEPRGHVPHAARRRRVRRRGADLVRQPGRHAAGRVRAASCRTTSRLASPISMRGSPSSAARAWRSWRSRTGLATHAPR